MDLLGFSGSGLYFEPPISTTPRPGGGTPGYFTTGGIRRSYSQRKRSVTSAGVLNQQSSLRDIQRNVPAEGQPIPIVYGQAQVGGKIFAIDWNASTKVWTVGYFVALGEIESYVKIWVNGVDSTAISGLSLDTSKKGTTSQTASTLLTGAIPGYTDTLVIDDPAGDIGVAYIVLQFSYTLFPQWPEVIVEIQGRKCFNPSTSPQSTVYTENPALHLADYLRSPIYGLGLTVDNTSLIAAQAYCDDLIGSPQETRRKGYFVLDNPQTVETVIGQMETYASAWVVIRGNEAFIVPDKAGSSIKTLTAANVVEGSMRIEKKDSSDLPTVIRATYTDTSQDVWREMLCEPVKAAGVDAGTTPWRESRINLTGVTRHSQAFRECIERLDKLWLSDLDVTWETFDEALELELGDIVTLTHPYGLSSRTLRLIDPPRQVRPGRWQIRAVEYSAAAYDATVDAGPTVPDITLPNGGIPAAPASLTATPVHYQTVDGVWAARFKISWTAPADGSLVSHYFVTVYLSGQPVWTTTVDGTVFETATPALEEGVTYDISVAAEFSGVIGPSIVDAETLTYNTTGPSAPTGLSASVRAGIVYLDWDAMANAFYYEIRHGASGVAWASATVLDPVRYATRLTVDATANLGTTRRYLVRACDSIGNQSTTSTVEIAIPVQATITVFYQGQSSDGIPTSLAIGDVWYDTDNDSRAYQAQIAGADAITAGEWELQSDTLQEKVDVSYVNTVSTIQTASFTAVAQNRYGCDTETAPTTTFNLTLPNSPSHMQQVYWWDAAGFFDQNPLIIKQAASNDNIMEVDEDMICDVRFFSGGLIFVTGTGWQLVGG